MEDINYLIVRAHYAFKCPICGMYVRKGDNCINDAGALTCTCIMPDKPARKLISIAEYQVSKI